MHYQDAIYGSANITEAVLVDLMESEAMQRLKAIYQHGITALLGITAPFSRFDHSVGAMLLVRRMGATLEEQIAALLHDVSHTAFSHVIDFVFDDHVAQSYHEEKKEVFIAQSDLPERLAHHGMDWRDFLDEQPFQLLEQPSPALCADRLDYLLRDLEFLGLATSGEIQAAIQALTVREGRIVVDSPDIARWLAYTFIAADRASWSNFREVGLYQVAAEAIRQALQAGFVSEVDLWGTDAELWDKLQAADHPALRQAIKLLSPGTRFTWADKAPSFTVTTKVRSIDPHVVCRDTLTPLSEIDVDFRNYRDRYISEKQGPWPMGILEGPTAAPR